MPDLVERIELSHANYLKYYRVNDEVREKLLGDLFYNRDGVARMKLNVGPKNLGKYYFIKSEEMDKTSGWRVFYAEAHYWRK